MNSINLYEDILTISKEIELLVELKKFDKVEELVDKRALLIEQISEEDFSNQEIQKIIDQIKALDEKNFAHINEHKKELGQKLSSLSKNIKCVSMYKIPNTYNLNFIDEKS